MFRVVECLPGRSNGLRLPAREGTVWNQIEAALAYGRDLPLLVICEHGLHDDGLLGGRYDWKVFWTDFSTTELASDGFSGYLESWKKLVLARKVSPPPVTPVPVPSAPQEADLSKLPLSRLVGMLTLPQITTVLGTLFSMFAAVAAAACKLGGGKWPWA